MNSKKSKKVQKGKKEMRKQQKGFSLIELLIVVAIILIIAAIAIPNLMRARMAANDSSAAASEHTIIVGEVGYLGAYPQLGYGTLAQLGGAASPCVPAPATGCLTDNNLATNGNALGKSVSTFAAVPGGAGLPVRHFSTTTAPPPNLTATQPFASPHH